MLLLSSREEYKEGTGLNYRTFGKTGEKVSVLGYGCMRLPVLGEDMSKVNIPEIKRMIHHAIDQGVNYIDTAYIYHQGKGEEAVAKALEGGYREKVYLATKLPVWNVKKRKDMDQLLNEQLNNLQTEMIDFYLVHSLNRTYWSKLVNLGLFEFLTKAKETGKVKHLGFSFHDDFDQFKQIIDSFPWGFCQIQYNYLDETFQAGKKGLKYAANKELGIAIMEPLRGGTLANQLIPGAKTIIEKAGTEYNPAQLALKWVWSHPEVGVVLSGMTEMENVKDNIRYSADSENPLTEEETRIIKEIQKVYQEKVQVNCTACRYCLPCSSGVDIPQCFEYYNKAFVLDDVKGARFWYNRISKASNCTECGQCETHCPQNIPIISKLKDVKSLFETSAEVNRPSGD